MYAREMAILAAGGQMKNVKIFDKRESKIVQTFDGIHTRFLIAI